MDEYRQANRFPPEIIQYAVWLYDKWDPISGARSKWHLLKPNFTLFSHPERSRRISSCRASFQKYHTHLTDK